MIQGLETKLEESNGANAALTTALQEALETKADEAALVALALEQAATAKQVVAVVAGDDPHQAQMTEKLSDAKAQVRELQTEVKELRKTLGGKAEQKDVAALDTRMDGYATQKDIESTRELLSSKIAQRAEDAATRSAKLEHVTGVDHAGRLVEIEKLLPTMHPSEDATANYATIDAELKRQHDVAEARHAEHSKKAEKLNGTADVRADEARLRLLPLLRPLLPPPASTR